MDLIQKRVESINIYVYMRMFVLLYAHLYLSFIKKKVNHKAGKQLFTEMEVNNCFNSYERSEYPATKMMNFIGQNSAGKWLLTCASVLFCKPVDIHWISRA